MRINTDEYIFVGFVGFVPKISAENMLPSKTPHPMKGEVKGKELLSLYF